MKCEFRNSFARDLRARRKDQDFRDRVKEAIEEIEQAQDLSEISNLKNSRVRVTITGFASATSA